MRLGCWALALLVVVGLGTTARAQPPPRIRLQYLRADGASVCPDGQAVAAGVAGRLGYDPFDAAAAGQVRVTVSRRDRTLEARIEMLDPAGRPKAERLLTSQRSDCAELAATMELAIAIAIDPFQGAGPLPTSPAPSPPPAVPPASAQLRAAARAEPAVAKPSPKVTRELALAAVAGIGAGPAHNLGAALRFSARRNDLSLGIEGRADLPGSQSLAVGDVSTSLLVASLVPCAHLGMAAACGLVTGGAMRSAAHGLVDARQTTDPYLALGIRVAARLPVSSNLSLTAQADLAAPLLQTELLVGGQELWTTPPVSFLLGLGLAVALP